MSLFVTTTNAEHDSYHAAAAKENLGLGAWVRKSLNMAAVNGKREWEKPLATLNLWELNAQDLASLQKHAKDNGMELQEWIVNVVLEKSDHLKALYYKCRSKRAMDSDYKHNPNL